MTFESYVALAIVLLAIATAYGYVRNANAIDDAAAKLRAEMAATDKFNGQLYDGLVDRVAELEVADRRRLARVLRAPLKAVKKGDGDGGTGGSAA